MTQGLIFNRESKKNMKHNRKILKMPRIK